MYMADFVEDFDRKMNWKRVVSTCQKYEQIKVLLESYKLIVLGKTTVKYFFCMWIFTMIQDIYKQIYCLMLLLTELIDKKMSWQIAPHSL